MLISESCTHEGEVKGKSKALTKKENFTCDRVACYINHVVSVRSSRQNRRLARLTGSERQLNPAYFNHEILITNSVRKFDCGLYLRQSTCDKGCQGKRQSVMCFGG